MVCYFLWAPDPEILSLGVFHLRWFTVVVIAGIVISRLYFLRKAEESSVSKYSKLFWFMLIGAYLGGRTYYALTEDLSIFKRPWELFIPLTTSGKISINGIFCSSLLGSVIGFFTIYITTGPLLKLQSQVTLKKSIVTILILLAAVRIGNFFESKYYGAPTDASTATLFMNPIKEGMLNVSCCVMRNPNGPNPLTKVIIEKGKTLVHEGVGRQPIIIYPFFKSGATEQSINEFLIGDIKTYLYNQPTYIYEPGSEPLHYTIYEESKNEYMARIQSIGIARHPVQLYECCFYGLLILFSTILTTKFINSSVKSALCVLSFGVFYCFTEFLKGHTGTFFIAEIPITIDHICSAAISLVGIYLLIKFRGK